MTQPFDVSDDVNRQQLYALDRLCGLPDFVKTAADDSKETIQALPNSVFADTANRKFPCHTKIATWLANAYFQQNKHLYPKEQAQRIQGSIDKFASWFKIASIVNDHNKRWEKVANFGAPDMRDEDFALVYTLDTGVKVRRMPMPNALSVKEAGEYLYANRFMYTYPMRKQAAKKILERVIEAEEKMSKTGSYNTGLAFNFDTREYLLKAAGVGATTTTWASEKIAQRSLMMPDKSPYRAKLAELSKSVKEWQNPSRDAYIKLAEAIDAVDRETGIFNHYQDGIDLPEEIFFQVSVKQAEAARSTFITLQNDEVLDVGTIGHLPLEKISEALGKDFADAVSENGSVSTEKFAEIAPTLPRDDANLLSRMIKASLEKEARAYGAGDPSNYTKDAMTAFFKKKGAKVDEKDFTFHARMNHSQEVSHV